MKKYQFRQSVEIEDDNFVYKYNTILNIKLSIYNGNVIIKILEPFLNLEVMNYVSMNLILCSIDKHAIAFHIKQSISMFVQSKEFKRLAIESRIWKILKLKPTKERIHDWK